MSAIRAMTDGPPQLRPHRSADGALFRMPRAVVMEFGADADALTYLRAARQMIHLALDTGSTDATAAGLALVQLAIDRAEADAAMVCDRLLALLDATQADYRDAFRWVLKEDAGRARAAFLAGRDGERRRVKT